MNSRLLCTFLITVLLLVACGPDVITGRPPFVAISSMALNGDKLSADFDIRNENGIEMTIDQVEIRVKVQESELTDYSDNLKLTIDANSVEKVQVDELPDEFTQDLLRSLQNKEIKSLPFEVEGRVHTLEDGNLVFAHKGYLYPVPGKPNEFRASVTYAEGLKREKPD